MIDAAKWQTLVLIGLLYSTRVEAADKGATAEATPRRAVPCGQAAATVDALLKKELSLGGKSSQEAARPEAARVGDERFLRRVMLDLVGAIPTAEELTAFALDPTADKRTKKVEALLADPRYGTHWARYWRDVIFYRRSDDRTLIATPAAVRYLEGEFRRNASWSEIATEMITATGLVHEEGRTAILFAQQARPEEVTAEVARIFLGIQIQCAQCHDHPTDRWKREQFHELAAFFPRVALRPTEPNNLRSLAVISDDAAFRFRGKNNDNRYRGTAEHAMPNLKNPEAEGKVMTPTFFVSGEKIELGQKDADRRETLARWMTSPANEWFAKAYVNRIWSEMVGEGFYEPVDDIGPDRSCLAPETLSFLAREFAASNYDCRWLFRTICETDIYQRESRARRNATQRAFAANVSQRLRGDQIFNSVLSVLSIDEASLNASRGYGGGGNPREMLREPRFLFNYVFGYDPSESRDEVSGSIPQALALMNSPQLGAALKAGDKKGGIGKLLANEADDRAVTQELYLRVLAREPTAKEMKTAVAYLAKVGNRAEGFEDLTWALLNSAEFLHRR